jgi:hypothetical protein
VAGERFFPVEITLTVWAYPAVLIGVPLAAAVASVISLYRVDVSPLGVSRRVTPPAPRAWRLVVLAVGLPAFCVPLLIDAQSLRHNPAPAMLALALVIAGLVVAGPWLTMRAARLLARTARSGSGVLAARRLADNPRAAYRSVSGLVLAVMVGTALATIVPVAVGTQQTAQDSQLADVLRIRLAAQAACRGGCGLPVSKKPQGMPSATAATLLAQLSAIPGVDPVPVWADQGGGLISCADLRLVPALGSCAAGSSVQTDIDSLFTDNLAALDKTLPLITPTTATTTDTSAGRGLITALVVTDSADALERARTLLSQYTVPSDDPYAAPQTFGEVGAARSALYLEVQAAVAVVAGLTLLIAGCSLAVSFSGGIVERRRPFTLLRLTGTPVRALYRVVLLETVFPLVSATVLAVVVGFAVAVPVAWALAPKVHGLPVPDATYYLTLGSGMVLAVAVILAGLPILRRITVTDSIRFE